MKDLSISIIQSPLHWENQVANLAMFEEKIWKVEKSTDVIILPEMFSTGFSMNAPALAEVMNQHTFKWMKQMANQSGALIIGSFIVKENGNFFNRLLWMEPGGNFNTYDKRHLFRMGEENTVYSAGKNKFIGQWRGWNICPLVCYDLRFPVWSRNTWNKGENKMEYDLLIYVANWPEARVSAWDALLRARAIENQSYVVGVNRIGSDGKEIPYSGHSAVIGPKGETLYSAEEAETINTQILSGKALKEYRDKFPAYLDGDKFEIQQD
ncbi:MAG: amidohydrolase [Cyclobacteriaceae bacterium]|nr:amidohydrolase [Cyclobacteriaceae bacterium]